MPEVNIAVVLALGSALCIALGDVLQQRAAHCIEDRSTAHIELLVSLLRSPRWWWGAALLVASLGLQAAALRHGSVLLVQALLMLSLLFALPMNARFTQHPVGRGEWIWAGLLTVAVITTVVLGNPQTGRMSAPLRTWVGVAIVLGPLLAVAVVAARRRGGAVAALLYALVSGSLWGIFAVLAKEVVAQLGGGWSVIRLPELYAALAVAVGGVVGSQFAFRAGPLTASMPALQVSQPVVATTLGVVVLGETLSTGWAGLIGLAAAIVVMAAAVVKLARVEAAAARDVAAVARAAHAGESA